jgi:hypothetical protein
MLSPDSESRTKPNIKIFMQSFTQSAKKNDEK